ncbi:uncharacterized protein LOC133533669 [Cydia pomonella]|uniref:uncharacterized protein LOC133527416 n=1 Tax=Cydia pomonella TaxID=82600 RepID=UPI002ADD6EC3|nr:uncharacterized protein LOC133527416 [Cydia pomonella]XP_061728678.1 uncharacterized protein LOC133533669 [Cydia pomonella]
MCWRQVSKLQKSVLIVLFYFTVYVLVSYSMSPDTDFAFVSDDLRVGDKYALIYLVAPRSPVFTDAEGANVFKSRRCGQCFITNNRGFLPMSEYDAILVLGDRSLLYETSAFMDPGKRFLIETSRKCVKEKLRGCSWEPRITSFGDNKPYDLCSLCEHLHRKRLKPNS